MSFRFHPVSPVMRRPRLLMSDFILSMIMDADMMTEPLDVH